MFRPIRLLILTGLLVTAAVAPSAAQGKAVIGISDNKPFMFSDNDFKALGAKDVRLVVGWNVMTPKTSAGKAEKVRVAKWMAAAKAGGYKVLVALDASKDKKRGPAAPKTPAKLAAEVKKLKKAYPQIKAISPWNEANLNKKPKQVAEWTKAVRKKCKGCKIVTDTVDKPNLVKWTKSYIKEAKKLGVTPKLWGLHNYVDVNNFTTKRTKAFLKVTKKGDVWLTETGGVANRAAGVSSFAGKGVEHQTKATTFLFEKTVKPFPRIKKVFVYNYNNDIPFSSGFLSWDSALKDSNGTLRPSYEIVKANH